MDRFRNILAVYGDGPGSDDVLVQAVSLACRSGARLTVVAESPRARGSAVEARRRLVRIAPWIAQEGVEDVAFDVVAGPPHAWITRRVREHGHDLVIVSSEGYGAIRDVIFGSTATNLLLQCPCAIWVLKPAQTVPCASVAAALELATDDPAAIDLDRRILGIATSLADSLSAHLHLIHFWDVEARDSEMLRSEIRDATRNEILDRNEATRRAALGRLLADQETAAPAHDVHLQRGRPQLQLIRLAEQLSVDVLVIGATCRRGLARLLMGNASEAVLHGVRCSVLAVKPQAPVVDVLPVRHRSLAHQARAAVW